MSNNSEIKQMGTESIDLYPPTTSRQTIDDIPPLLRDWIETVKAQELNSTDLTVAKELVEGYNDYTNTGD